MATKKSTNLKLRVERTDEGRRALCGDDLERRRDLDPHAAHECSPCVCFARRPQLPRSPPLTTDGQAPWPPLKMGRSETDPVLPSKRRGATSTAGN